MVSPRVTELIRHHESGRKSLLIIRHHRFDPGLSRIRTFLSLDYARRPESSSIRSSTVQLCLSISSNGLTTQLCLPYCFRHTIELIMRENLAIFLVFLFVILFCCVIGYALSLGWRYYLVSRL